MNGTLASRELYSSLAAAAFVVAAAALLLLVIILAPIRETATVLGAGLCFLAAYASGNPRLFCLWGLLLTIPLNLSKYFGPIFYERGSGEMAFRIELSDLFLLALVLFLARDLWTGQRIGVRLPKVAYFWSAIMFMGCWAAILGEHQYAPLHEVVRMFKVMILFVVICNELESPRRVLHSAAGLTVALAMEAGLGALQFYKKGNLGLEILGETDPKLIEILGENTVYTESVWRVSGTLLHPNLFGIFLAVLLPLAIGLFLLRECQGYKLLILSGIVLSITSLIATLSRASWLSFAAAFALLMFLMISHRGLRRRSLLAASAAVLVLAIVSVAFSGPILTRVFQSKEDSALGRAAFKEDAKGMIAVKPLLGWGLNNYVEELPPFTKFSLKAFGGHLPPVHHIYYLWSAETGLIGLTIHLLMWGGILWAGVRNLRIHDEVMFTVNAACLAGMLAFVVDGFFSFSLRMNAVSRVFWVLAGIILAIRYWRLRQAAVPARNLERVGAAIP